ncbi:hypothetical protein FSW04_01750 [Baekduia soli]|uniref:Uncharacterized protein n=1 Tax=Baekduia soli TaxID=496014 RepID=A0A5B8U0B2_9ACTN|nr:hypothetical protein [Baekduia soli]QEC46426.1 hypothetical protein FSW04_01750 [Baekduia soli]
MFFDTLGRILQRSAEVLETEIRPVVDDGFLGQQVDAIALIVGEIGAAWPELFAALERTNAILESTLRDVAPGAAADLAAGDLLRRNRELLVALDAAVEPLHAGGEGAALTRLRAGLRDAAVVEHDLLERAVHRAGLTSTRRL